MNEHLFWRDKLLPFTTKSDTIGAWQTLNTIIPLVSLWIAYAYLVKSSPWVVVPFTVVLTLFNLRSFVIMHDCGTVRCSKPNAPTKSSVSSSV